MPSIMQQFPLVLELGLRLPMATRDESWMLSVIINIQNFVGI